MNNTILITGGSGFIGTHLINALLFDSDVDKIIVLDVHPPKVKDHKIKYIYSDLRKKVELTVENCNIIYHLAALCKEPGYEWEEYFETNYFGTKNIIDFAEVNEIKNIIFTSTMMVFEAGEYEYYEDSLTAPDTAYGISKLLAEKELEKWKEKDLKRQLSIIRPGVVYGIGEKANMTRLFNAIKKNFFAYVGKNSTIKGIIYVKDLVKLIHWLIENRLPFETYNFVYPEKYTIKNIVDTYKEVFNFKRAVPVLPFYLLLFVSYFFEFFNIIGIRNSIHHRRIEKLFYSTNLSSQKILTAGFKFDYDLKTSIEDWHKESGNKGYLL